ncbi:T9SS type A sorting domain-containing protein [Formosa sp. PL04]|uniref:T9SS type A sorting domain-containing protein n=1 Tax=Formosa sp. PL04 TaxID=3081755 RepID=UPI002981A4F3|nr:T9SS type A sorting domain-containing protein [Formosa sp. PL04]MDW5288103.1 T9SS type A sorting domain-containing protein [Formosa sp. PL04]
MKTSLLKKNMLFLALLLSAFMYGQSVTFDSSSITIDTNGKILLVDGVEFDAISNPIKFSQVDIPEDAATMFATLREDYVFKDNWNGGVTISDANNTTLAPGTASAQIVMGPGSVPANSIIFEDGNSISVGQSNLTFNLRSKISSGPNVFIGAVIPVTVAAPLGIEDYQRLEGVTIFPNPAKEMLNIACPNGSQISVYNLLGAKIKLVEGVSKKVNLSVSDLASGLYIVKVENEGQFYVKKIQIN